LKTAMERAAVMDKIVMERVMERATVMEAIVMKEDTTSKDSTLTIHTIKNRPTMVVKPVAVVMETTVMEAIVMEAIAMERVTERAKATVMEAQRLEEDLEIIRVIR